MGSRGRGALTEEELAALERGELQADQELEAGDVLMEVLAEDHRLKKTRSLEFGDGESAGSGGADDDAPQQTAGPRVAHRKYLTHGGVGPGTAYQRQQAAQRLRLETAEAHAFDYRMPQQVKDQREHERRSRAKMREHDVIENRIQEAMASGAFDDLPGAGKPLKQEENVFEAISGDAMAHRILKNAGIAPGWVEQRKEIRAALTKARAHLAMEWDACVPLWPPPPLAQDEETGDDGLAAADDTARQSGGERTGGKAEATQAPRPGSTSGGWRVYHEPTDLPGRGAVLASAAAEAAEAAEEVAKKAKAEAAAAMAAERSDAARLVSAAAAGGPQPAHWAATVAHFEDEVRAVNKLIETYNLSVPASWQQIHKLQPAAELTRALYEAPERAVELKAERRSQRLEHAPGHAAGAEVSAAALLGGPAPTFAMREGPMFPNLLESLVAVLRG